METTNTNNPTAYKVAASVSDHMAELEVWLNAYAQAQMNFALGMGREDVSTMLTLNDEVMRARSALVSEIRHALGVTEVRARREAQTEIAAKLREMAEEL